MTKTYTAVAGVIRDGVPVATLLAPRNKGEKPINFVFLRGKEEVGVVTRSWPRDFTFDDPDVPDQGHAALTEAAELGPYTAVQPRGRKGALEVGLSWNLNKLFASTEAEFCAHFFRSRKRVRDRETQLFAANQIMRHYRLNQSHRCVAAVVQGFRAMDLGGAEFCARAIADLEQELAESPTLPDTANPRTDRSHLTISMGAVLWQLYLYTGQYREFRGRLDAIVAFIRTLDNPFPGVILNGCLTILMRAYIHLLEDQPAEASELAHFNADFYVAQMARMPHKAIWYKEMMLSHNAAFLGLEMEERIRGKRRPLSPKLIVEACNRVNYPPAVAQLEKRFVFFCRKIRAAARKAAVVADPSDSE